VSAYVYAIHEPNPLAYKGWVVHLAAVGHDPYDGHGWNFAAPGKTAICRINHGYGRAGTIPRPSLYEAFAQRCANVAAASEGCERWVVGNEPNHPNEWPEGETITPGMYGACFRMVRAAIRGVPGHEGDRVIVAGVAPWCAEVRYSGNEGGDWVQYLADVLQACGAYDGVALHAYSRSADPGAVISEARMRPPFGAYCSEFRAYRDFMEVIPEGAPIYMTEVNPGADRAPWPEEDTGWVGAMYDEVARWNCAHPEKVIRCAALYRWPNYDRWGIEGKRGVVADFERAVGRGLRWRAGETPEVPGEGPEVPGEVMLRVADAVRRVAWGLVELADELDGA